MNDEQFRAQGFAPLACVMHAEPLTGDVVGHVLVCKRIPMRYFVASLMRKGDKLAYGAPIEVDRREVVGMIPKQGRP